MKLSRLHRSFTLRLMLLYLLMFTASVGVLVSALWWGSVLRPMQAIGAALQVEANGLAEVYARGGQPALVRALSARPASPAARAGYHVLVSPSGAVVAGRLPIGPEPLGVGPVRVEFDAGDQDDRDALAVRRDLPGGGRLWVARDIEDLDDRESLIREALGWSAAIAPLLGLGVGLLMSFAVGRRIEAVARTARKVMAGNLSERVTVRGSGDDFDLLAGTLNLMLDRIERLVQSVSSVSDQIAHDLRTPLTRLRAELTDLAAEPALGLALGERVTAARAEADHLQATFDALLRVARLEASADLPEPTAVDLTTLLADAAELYLPTAQARGLTLRTDLAPGLTVTGDRHLLFQAVANLLDNAVKYVPEGGGILLAAIREHGRIAVNLTDDGPGVGDAHRGRIVERFYRGPGGEGSEGLGLGLSLVAAVMKLHGAVLAFEDARPGLRVRMEFGAV